jgi:hypothetical protein
MKQRWVQPPQAPHLSQIPIESRVFGIQSERSGQERIRIQGNGRTPSAFVGGRDLYGIRAAADQQSGRPLPALLVVHVLEQCR